MFLRKQANEIKRRKQACLVRTALNRQALVLMVKQKERPSREKILTYGIMAVDLIYGIWKSRDGKVDRKGQEA